MKTLKTPNKKPWYKRWRVWAYTFAVIWVIGMFAPDAPEEVAEPEAVEAAKVEAPLETPEEAAKEKADAERRIAERAEADAKKKAEDDAKKKKAAEAKKAEKAEAVMDGKDSVQAIIDLSEGIILSIDPNPYSDAWEVTHVTVSDDWYLTAEHQKERFAETVGASVKAAIASEVTHVHFFDSYGKEIATEKMFGGYKLD